MSIRISNLDFIYNQTLLANGTRYPRLKNQWVSLSEEHKATPQDSEDVDLLILLLSILPIVFLVSYSLYKLLYCLLRPKTVKDEAYAVWLTLTKKQRRPKHIKKNAHEDMLIELDNLAYEEYNAKFDEIDNESKEDILDLWDDLHKAIKKENYMNSALQKILKTISYIPVSVYAIVVFAMCIANCEALDVETLMNRHYEGNNYRVIATNCVCTDGEFTCAATCSSLKEVLSPLAFYSKEEVTLVKVKDFQEEVAVSCRGGSKAATLLREEWEKKGFPFTDLSGECQSRCVFGAATAIHGFNLDVERIRTNLYQFTGVISDDALISEGLLNILDKQEKLAYEVIADGLECPTGFILEGQYMYCVDPNGVIGQNMWLERGNESLADGWVRANGPVPASCSSDFKPVVTKAFPFSGDCSFVATGKTADVNVESYCSSSGNAKWTLCDESVKCVSTEGGYTLNIAGCRNGHSNFFANSIYSVAHCTDDCTFDPSGEQGQGRNLNCGKEYAEKIPQFEYVEQTPRFKPIRLAIFAILMVAFLVMLVFLCWKS